MACESSSGKILLGKCCKGYTPPSSNGWYYKALEVRARYNQGTTPPGFDGLQYVNDIAADFDWNSIDYGYISAREINLSDATDVTNVFKGPVFGPGIIGLDSVQQRSTDGGGTEFLWFTRYVFLNSLNFDNSCDKHYDTPKSIFGGGAPVLINCELVTFPKISVARIYASTEETIYQTSVQHELSDPCCGTPAP